MRPKLDEGLDWITASEWVAGFSCVLKLFFGQAAVGHAVGQAVGHAVGHAVGQTPRLLGAVIGAGRARALGWVAPAWRWVSSDVRSLRSCLLGLFVVWRGCEWRGVVYSAFPWFGVAACGLESVLRSGLAGGFSSALEWFGSACSSSYVTFGRCERLSGTPSGTPWGTCPGCWARRKSLASCTLSSTPLGKRSSCWARRALGTLSAVGQAPRLLGAVSFKA